MDVALRSHYQECRLLVVEHRLEEEVPDLLLVAKLAHSIKVGTAVRMAPEEVVAIMEEEAAEMATIRFLVLEEDPAMSVAVQTLALPRCSRAPLASAPVQWRRLKPH